MTMKLLYLCSSQFSGSTLLSFLLNNHSKVATIGHTTGWRYSANEDFRCSCTRRINECPLFARIRLRFESNALTFNPQDFGTAFKLSENARINQLLVGPIPGTHLSWLEHCRDKTVDRLRSFRDRLSRQELANAVLIRAVLDFYCASVYLDNSHSPYRFRRLRESRHFSVMPIHLIRDPRGVSLSLMTNSGFSVAQAIRSWIRHQLNILRITKENTLPLVLRYESLCRDPHRELAMVHKFAGLAPEPICDDFKAQDHHILGNRMRLNVGAIRLDERWRRDLSSEERRVIEKRLVSFCSANPDNELSAIINSYLTSVD